MAVFTISEYNHGNTPSQERYVQVLRKPPAPVDESLVSEVLELADPEPARLRG